MVTMSQTKKSFKVFGSWFVFWFAVLFRFFLNNSTTSISAEFHSFFTGGEGKWKTRIFHLFLCFNDLNVVTVLSILWKLLCSE